MKAFDFQDHAEKMFPVVPHLGLAVKELNADRCVLTGKAVNNLNHIGTVFGGSLYSFAALACYGWLFANLDNRGIKTHNLVISEGQINYKAPVTADFEVQCLSPSATDVQNFFQSLTKKGKARINLTSQVICKGTVCAEFTGTYVSKLEAFS